MKRMWTSWLGVLLACLLMIASTAPARALDDFDQVAMSAYVAVSNNAYDCRCMPVETSEERNAVAYVNGTSTDAMWQRFSKFWQSMPDYTQDSINDFLDLAAKQEAAGYTELAKESRAVAARMSTYVVPAIDVANQRGQNSVFTHYATVVVNGDQITITPSFANVTVQSATVTNGVIAASIGVTDSVSGAVYTYAYNTITQLPTPPAGKAFSKTYTPKVSGTTRVGKTLSASVKTWSPKASFSYQWLRNGTAIDGATKSKYTLTAADLSSVISVTVTGSRTGYASVTKTSANTKVITPGIITRGKIKITGTGRVGRVRTASTSKWTSGVTFTYQWYRNGVFIEGATAKTYTQSPADKGKRLTVVVTASKNGYVSPVSKASKRTGKIKTGYLTKVTPLITGDAIVGQVLTVTPGTWKPVDTTFTYQWYRNGKKITGQTGVSYTVQAGDVGKTIKVKVTGKALAYYTSYRYSHSTAKVVAAIVPTPTPTPSAAPDPSPSPSATETSAPPTPTATSSGTP